MSAEPVLFCCNTGPQVGLGHLMRVREMARHLVAAGHPCLLYGPPEALARPEDRALFTLWQPETGAEVADSALRARVLVALAQARGSRRLVIDDYRGDMAFQDVLAAAGMHWLQQFDASLTDRHYRCPVLVNASPWERPEHYRTRLPDPGTQALFGPRYAVIRPEFRAITPQPDDRPLRRLLIAFGGGDDRGMTLRALDALASRPLPGVTPVIVSGAANPALAQIAARVAEAGTGAELHVAPPDMAGLIAGCDLGLIAGGTMSSELAICGVPAVLVALAGNQANPCRGWQALTGAPYLGTAAEVTPEAIAASLGGLAGDRSARARMAAAGRAAVDGLGTERLTAALLEREMA